MAVAVIEIWSNERKAGEWRLGKPGSFFSSSYASSDVSSGNGGSSALAPVPAGGFRSLAEVYLSTLFCCPLLSRPSGGSSPSPSWAPQQFKVPKPVFYIKFPVSKGLGQLWFYAKAVCNIEMTSRATSGRA